MGGGALSNDGQGTYASKGYALPPENDQEEVFSEAYIGIPDKLDK